jgi:hypothetical protein
LYVGKSEKLGYRLLQFWNGEHPASGFLYVDLKVACNRSRSEIPVISVICMLNGSNS